MRKVKTKPPDGYKPSSKILYALSNDIDANSVGFVDIADLRALEAEDRVSIATLPRSPNLTKQKERKSFLCLRQWITRRRRSNRRPNLATSTKHSAQGYYLEIHRPKPLRTFSTALPHRRLYSHYLHRSSLYAKPCKDFYVAVLVR
ncbi:hypothetical protein KIN20_026961 [Parelaphostrongylus tenuis]|uniref:Uncharacterized protein n=1 Tax=Parelaphostrongylus tenuis TaxID=148309 RepID=A0AAD5QYP2_PARTN|nr:hypothetical protein KIN20_026961 [Parelaphostrongylus tenuis]